MIDYPKISSAHDYNESDYRFARRYSGYLESERDRRARIRKIVNNVIVTLSIIGILGLGLWSTGAAVQDERINGSPNQTRGK